MHKIAALYHFAPVADPAGFRALLEDQAVAAGVKGTLLVAREGVNGTIAGSEAGIDAVVAYLRAQPGFEGLGVKVSWSDGAPFIRLKVREKREIVTMGQPDLDPTDTGTYVPPSEWNALIEAPDVVVIDTRNSYETAIGSFKGAIDPGTESFREFPAWWAENGHRFANKRVAMFCTGGIRCEKSTAYLKSQGVEDVYHLQGGILQYLEDVAEEESSWEGSCFVFDERVSVEHGLEVGPHSLCRACRRPVSPVDRAHPAFEDGVQCPACVGEYSEADRARFRERQHQINLAKARGARHMGG